MTKKKEKAIDIEFPEKKEVVSKYSIIPKWVNQMVEIEANELNVSFNTVTKTSYIDFFDLDGRLWQIPEKDCVVIRNIPDKEDMEYFDRISREAKEHKKGDIKRKPEDLRDVM